MRQREKASCGKEKTVVWFAATRLRYGKIKESGGGYEKYRLDKILKRHTIKDSRHTGIMIEC